MLKASIDIGSNSILLLIADCGDDFKVIKREMKVTGLGRGIDKTKRFAQIAMDESYTALSEYRDILNQYSISNHNIVMTATEASRVADNAETFFLKVKEELDLEVCLISGEQEAYYSSLGVIAHSNIQSNRVVIMDIGGASTEFILCETNPFRVISSISLPIGSVRSSDWIKQGEKSRIHSVLGSNDLKAYENDTYICVAGTMTSVGNMISKNRNEFIEEKVNGAKISIDSIQEMQKKVENWDEETFLEEFPFLGKRSRVMGGGLYLARLILEKQGVRNIEVSTFGLIFGSILEIDTLRGEK